MKLKYYLKENASSLKKLAQANDVDEFIQEFSEEHGSAAEIWMSEQDKETLMKLVAGGKKVITKTFTITSKHKDEAKTDRDEVRYDNFVTAQEAKGFKVFAFEDNDDTRDLIMVQK